jgi:DNA-binding IscR family transcriptional regulator
MLRFTKRADYGLMAIHYIAVNEAVGAVSAKRIAEEFRIPAELLAKILQRLAKQG